MHLHEWAVRWGIPHTALTELCVIAGIGELITDFEGQSEAAVQQRIRADAPRHTARLWRNNVGAMKDASGRFVRFGLANDSRKLNTLIKSSDLIGIRSVLIGPEHLGKLIGQFVSIEVKEPGWRYAGTDREIAQLAWIKLILLMGGHAQFATGTNDMRYYK